MADTGNLDNLPSPQPSLWTKILGRFRAENDAFVLPVWLLVAKAVDSLHSLTLRENAFSNIDVAAKNKTTDSETFDMQQACETVTQSSRRRSLCLKILVYTLCRVQVWCRLLESAVPLSEAGGLRPVP